MERIKTTINSISDVMEQNNKGVELGCYSVALIGLTIAIRKVRPFSKFKKPSDIPNHFIRNRRELTGLVERINPDGGLLMIQHKPLVPVPLVSNGQLPVKISGVKVDGLGLSWLQTIVAGNEVKFIPVTKTKDCVECEVLLPQITRDNKERIVNVGESLVKIGFGRVIDVDKPLFEVPNFIVYRNQLIAAETYWLKKKLGLKYYVKPTRDLLNEILKIMIKLVKTTKREVPKIAAS